MYRRFKIRLNEDGKWELVEGDKELFARLFPKFTSSIKNGAPTIDGVYDFSTVYIDASIVAKNVATLNPAGHEQGVDFVITDDVLIGRKVGDGEHPGHYPTFEEIYQRVRSDYSGIRSIELDEMNKYSASIRGHRSAFPSLKWVHIKGFSDKRYFDTTLLDFIDGIEFRISNGTILLTGSKRGDKIYKILHIYGVLDDEDIRIVGDILNWSTIDEIQIISDYDITILYQLAFNYAGAFASSKIVGKNVYVHEDKYVKDGSSLMVNTEMLMGDTVGIASVIQSIGEMASYNFTLNEVYGNALYDRMYSAPAYAYFMSSGKLKIDAHPTQKYGHTHIDAYIKADENEFVWIVPEHEGDEYIFPPLMRLTISDKDGNETTISAVEVKEFNGAVVRYVSYTPPQLQRIEVRGIYESYYGLASLTNNVTVCLPDVGNTLQMEYDNLASLYMNPCDVFTLKLRYGRDDFIFQKNGNSFVWPNTVCVGDLDVCELLKIVDTIDIGDDDWNVRYNKLTKHLEVNVDGYLDYDVPCIVEPSNEISNKYGVNKLNMNIAANALYNDGVDAYILSSVVNMAKRNEGLDVIFDAYTRDREDLFVKCYCEFKQEKGNKFVVNGYDFDTDLDAFIQDHRLIRVSKFFYVVRNERTLEGWPKLHECPQVTTFAKLVENEKRIYEKLAELGEYTVQDILQEGTVDIHQVTADVGDNSGRVYVVGYRIGSGGKPVMRLQFDENLNMEMGVLDAMQKVGSILDKDGNVVGQKEDAKQEPPKDIKVEYTISKNNDGSITVAYKAIDADGKDVTDRFNTVTFGDYFLHKELL